VRGFATPFERLLGTSAARGKRKGLSPLQGKKRKKNKRRKRERGDLNEDIVRILKERGTLRMAKTKSFQ